MTTNEQTTLADRCARCDCAESGAPDAQALLADGWRTAAEAAERECDAIRRLDASAIQQRDAAQKALAAATQQRDEAREALRNLLTVVQHCYPLPSVPDADLYVRTAARILEVKP